MSNDHQNYPKAFVDIFSATVFCVYTWSIIITLWDISGLILHFSAWDLTGYIAYQITFALFESLIVTFIIVVFSFMLPKRFMRTDLSTSGSLLVFSLATILLSFMGLPIFFTWIMETLSISEKILLAQQVLFGFWLFLSLFLFFYAAFIPPKERGRRILKSLVERLYPLVGLYVFISIISLLIVIIRNVV